MIRGLNVFFARAIYALSWFYLAPEIPELIFRFHEPQTFSGLIPLSFFLGSGIMQLPAAFVGSKIGQRNSLVLGLVIMSASSFLLSVAWNFNLLLLFYALGGVGASFFFSSGGAIISSLNKERVSLALGLYNSLFCVGGIVGLNWGVVDEYLGFSLGSVAVGVLTLLSALLNLRLPNNSSSWSSVKNRRVLILGLSTAGVWGVYYAVGELFPSFLVFYQHGELLTSSAVTSLLLLFSAIGGSLGGLGDRFSRMRLLLVSSVLTSLSPLLLYTPAYVLGLAILGISNEMAISVLYSMVALEGGVVNSSVTLAEVNSLNIFFGTWLEFLAGFLGFSAWIALSVVGLLPLLLLLTLRNRT
jgi:Arabinose efflux permease